MEESNYRPSFAVQTPAGNTSSYVGLVLPAREVEFGVTLLPQLYLAFMNWKEKHLAAVWLRVRRLWISINFSF